MYQTIMKEHDPVVLGADLPQYGLKQGDVGTIVLVHREERGFEVEFTALDGETIAVVSLAPAQLRSIAPNEIAHARTREMR